MRVTRCFLEPLEFGASVEVVRASTDLPPEAFFLSHGDRLLAVADAAGGVAAERGAAAAAEDIWGHLGYMLSSGHQLSGNAWDLGCC